jgi:hypothetical protein
LTALTERHVAPFRTSEFTRALRALSARYVERRGSLPGRSPLDSTGKRAAFAAFYAPLHFLTVREIVRTLDAGNAHHPHPPHHPPIDLLLDLGCGTGVASAAWALELARSPELRGVDGSGWVLDEAKWNWRLLGLRGRAERGDMVDALARSLPVSVRSTPKIGIVAGWSVNELPGESRDQLLSLLRRAAALHVPMLVVEPLARSATPWWDEWASAFVGLGGRADVWKFDIALPPPLATLDTAAGFEREGLGARSLWFNAPA